MAHIVARELTQEEWQELECDIDSLQVFEKIFNALSEDAKQEFHGYVKDMISEGLHYESSRNDYNISVETLEKLQDMDQTQQLLLAPEFLFALLESFVKQWIIVMRIKMGVMAMLVVFCCSSIIIKQSGSICVFHSCCISIDLKLCYN